MPPARARAAHAAKLHQALGVAVAAARQQLQTRDAAVAEGEPGFYLDFEVPVEHQAALDGLENRPKNIELAVHPPVEGDETVRATVFVPEDEADYFTAKVEQDRDENTAKGNPKNQNLVARIDDARLAAVRSLFTDPDDLYPVAAQPVWWEAWLRDDRLLNSRAVAEKLNVVVKRILSAFPSAMWCSRLPIRQRWLVSWRTPTRWRNSVRPRIRRARRPGPSTAAASGVLHGGLQQRRLGAR